MIVEKRMTFGFLSVVLIPTPEEAKILDEVLGNKVVNDDGLITKVQGQYCLADGYGPAYIRMEPVKDL